jgi:nitrate/TMAO reductase-like tetraheme cytochrome c subunit
MNDSDSDSQGPSRSAATGPTDPGAEPADRAAVERTLRSRIWLYGLRAAAVLGALLLLMVLFTGAAGVYTSRPQFCRSCHIMEPYYVSWQKSSHANVSCIKCHFPPGVGEEIRGKLLGLVQLAKYVTASAGPRPVAEIPDASCLRSGCHETRLLSGRVEFKGLPFDHQHHMGELRRGMELRCTSCHSQIVQGAHMTVTTSTCFLCHFKNQYFNEGLGTCTRCHQIPDKAFDLGGGVTFHHDLAYEKGVNCANCHGDLIRGDGNVPPERCGVCHNREDDLKQIGNPEFIHQKHVTDHKIDCLDCHLAIHHSLDKDRIQHAAADCKACHPNQHGEQVRMLLGEGAQSVPARAGGMNVARIACPSCHRIKEVSPTGTVLWKASTETCIDCHDEADTEQLRVYHEQLRASLVDIDATLRRVREALASAALDATQAAAIKERLKRLQSDLDFLRVANGIHNIHYASTLTHALVDQLASLCGELDMDVPKAALPEELKLH